MAVTPRAVEWSFEQAFDVFTTFDVNGSGDLDFFEIKPAIEKLLGIPVPTALISELINKFDLDSTSRLSLSEFLQVVHGFDWQGYNWSTAPQSEIDEVYEVEFDKTTIGITVRNISELGTLVVNRIVDSDNVGKIHLGDTVRFPPPPPGGYSRGAGEQGSPLLDGRRKCGGAGGRS